MGKYICNVKPVVLSFNKYLLFSISSIILPLRCRKELHKYHNFWIFQLIEVCKQFQGKSVSKLRFQCDKLWLPGRYHYLRIASVALGSQSTCYVMVFEMTGHSEGPFET